MLNLLSTPMRLRDWAAKYLPAEAREDLRRIWREAKADALALRTSAAGIATAGKRAAASTAARVSTQARTQAPSETATLPDFDAPDGDGETEAEYEARIAATAPAPIVTGGGKRASAAAQKARGGKAVRS